MKRFRVSLLVVAGLIICGATEPRLSGASVSKPNIVFIMADDLGYGDLSCYGATDLSTPHLDQLASEGVRFTDFYANAAVCSPTRAAFLTGRYPQRIGLDNALYYQEMGRGLPDDGLTIADALQDSGYKTGLSGKWHVGYDFEKQPLQQGFDHFFGLLGGNHHYFEHMDRIGVPDLWPERISAAETVSLPATTMDWTSTIRRLIGLEADANYEEGIDLIPLLTGEISAPSERALFWRRKSGPKRKVTNPGRAVRRGDWKFFEKTDGSGEQFLFNLKNDPGEARNLIDQHRDLAAELSAYLDKWEASLSIASSR